MRQAASLFVGLATIGAAAAMAQPAGAAGHRLRSGRPEPAEPHVLGSAPWMLIQFDRARAEAAAPLLLRSGGELLSRQLRLWRVRTEAAASLLPLLRLSGALERVEPDRPLRPPTARAESDPLVSTEYWLALIGADRAESPGPGKPVSIVDTGLDATHPEFAQRPGTVLMNAQRVSGRDDDHGTAVASIVGAPENGVGLVGVYPQAVLQAWDASPTGSADLTLGDEIRGILTAARRGAGVINLSLGSEDYDRLEEEAILTAFRDGSIVVASAGNELEQGNPTEYPASLGHVLTVAATNQSDEPAFFSSSSPSVDLAAPGEDIPIAEPIAYDTTGYSVDDGTSFSAPMVSGATAWVWTARPELDNTQIFELMRRSARDVWKTGFDNQTGFGVLDIPAALAATAAPPDPQEPNDDVDQVKPAGLFSRGARTLNSSARPRAAVNARLDGSEDPDDVYRVYVPAGKRIVVFVVGDKDVDLDLWGVKTRTIFERGVALKRDLLASSEREGNRQELVRYTNRSRHAVTLYADVFLGKQIRSATYSLSVTPAAARR